MDNILAVSKDKCWWEWVGVIPYLSIWCRRLQVRKQEPHHTIFQISAEFSSHTLPSAENYSRFSPISIQILNNVYSLLKKVKILLCKNICFHQCCVSMTFCSGSGSGSGSADPCLWLMDPDSDPDPDAYPDLAIFVIDLPKMPTKN
jgi:hypothetical protein